MKFVIRDDDLNYFSKKEDVERWYRDIFAREIPVGFSVVPFVKPISDVYPRNLPYENKEYPISKNKELVEYIRNNRLIEVMQHGCTHETRSGIFEYVKKSGLIEETERGKKELEETFGIGISSFVAPHDSFSSHAIRAIEKSYLNIIRSKGSKNFLLRIEYVVPFLKMFTHRILHLVAKKAPAYPFILKFKKHKEAFSVRLDEPLDRLEQYFEYAYKKNSYFVLTAHLYTYKEVKKEKLLKLIELAKSKGDVEFVFPSRLF